MVQLLPSSHNDKSMVVNSGEIWKLIGIFDLFQENITKKEVSFAGEDYKVVEYDDRRGEFDSDSDMEAMDADGEEEEAENENSEEGIDMCSALFEAQLLYKGLCMPVVIKKPQNCLMLIQNFSV